MFSFVPSPFSCARTVTGCPWKKCHTTDHCRIIPAVTVSVKFHEIVKKRFDVVLSCRTCFGSGKLNMFPGSEISGWNEVRPDPIIFLNSFHRFLIVRLEPIFNVRIIGLYIIQDFILM